MNTYNITFYVPIKPVPWAIGYVNNRGPYPRISGNAQLIEYKKTLGKYFLAHRAKVCFCMDWRVNLNLSFYLSRPKSVKSEAHIKKPDLSNLVKSTEDAMKGIFFNDDNQVQEINAGKYYVPETGDPHQPGIIFNIDYYKCN